MAWPRTPHPTSDATARGKRTGSVRSAVGGLLAAGSVLAASIGARLRRRRIAPATAAGLALTAAGVAVGLMQYAVERDNGNQAHADAQQQQQRSAAATVARDIKFASPVVAVAQVAGQIWKIVGNGNVQIGCLPSTPQSAPGATPVPPGAPQTPPVPGEQEGDELEKADEGANGALPGDGTPQPGDTVQPGQGAAPQPQPQPAAPVVPNAGQAPPAAPGATPAVPGQH